MVDFHDYITCNTRLGIEIKRVLDELCDIIWVNGGIYVGVSQFYTHII